MRKILSNERGAISGYIIGVVLLMVAIGGGVVLFKNLAGRNSGESTDNKTETTQNEETVEVTNPENNPAENPTESNPQQSPETSPSDPATETNISNAAAALESDQYAEKPAEKVPATGPAEDFMMTTFGFLLIAGTVYAAWNYRLSRVAIKKSLSKIQ